MQKRTVRKKRLSTLERVIQRNRQSILLQQPISRVAPILLKELSDVVKQHKQNAAKKKAKNEEPDTPILKKQAPSLGYQFKGTIRETYALPVYESVNTYELYYGKGNKKHIQANSYEEGKNSTPDKEEDAHTLNPEQASNTIQRIIYGVLFGSRADISVEERERFANWRQFHKHLRRMYEGEAHYFSSTTKAI